MDTIKTISLNLNVSLLLSVNTVTNEIVVKDCGASIINLTNDNQMKFTEHKINETENRYGILTLGAKSAVGRLIPTATEISIEIDGKKFISKHPIITHKSTRGRIDGLTQFFRENKEKLAVGAVLYISYDPQKSILKLKSNLKHLHE